MLAITITFIFAKCTWFCRLDFLICWFEVQDKSYEWSPQWGKLFFGLLVFVLTAQNLQPEGSLFM